MGIVAVPASGQVLAFRASTGTWITHGVAGLALGDQVVAAGDVGIVVVAASGQVLGFSGVTGTWTAHGVAGLSACHSCGRWE